MAYAYGIRVVIKTFEKDLFAGGLNALIPLERIDSVAHPDEVKQVVVNRSGSILSASTIVKSDFFSNLQKMTLPECVCRRDDYMTLTTFREAGGLMDHLTSVVFL